MTKLPEHLGGHQGITHTDGGALDYLIERFALKTAIDLGCGPGWMVSLMRQRGLDCTGIDGDWTLCPASPFILHDFYVSPLDIEPVDLCWSVEFLEHIHTKHMRNVWPTIEQCRVMFCTHALPADSGRRRHVNCRVEQYWIDRFAEHGFLHDEEATAGVREASTMEREFVQQSGKVFVRKG